METELGRLERMYGELGDEHLLDLQDDAADLTDEARYALTQELRRRGIGAAGPVAEAAEPVVEEERESGFGPGIPGMFPSGAAVMEQALEVERPRKDGLSSLISFYDGLELSKACGFLEDAEMEPVIEAIDGDAMVGVPPRFEIWLDSREIEGAQRLLRVKMGLFPVSEVEGEGYAHEAATGLVGVFASREEAEPVRAMLVEAGFAARMEQEDGEWEVTVDPQQQERAVEVVAGAMGLG